MKDKDKDKEDAHLASIITFPGQDPPPAEFQMPKVPETPAMLEGFILIPNTANPGLYAAKYHEQRTQLNQLLIKRPVNTWITKFVGKSRDGIQTGDYLVIENGRRPQVGSLTLVSINDEMTIARVTAISAGRAGSYTLSLRNGRKTFTATSDQVSACVMFSIHQVEKGVSDEE